MQRLVCSRLLDCRGGLRNSIQFCVNFNVNGRFLVEQFMNSNLSTDMETNFDEEQIHKPEMHPSFRRKQVYILNCIICGSIVCRRGMLALLLADDRKELFSTDTPDKCALYTVEEENMTEDCKCMIKAVACMECGNTVGYHVFMPCKECLRSCNNGHYWMLYSNSVISSLRWNIKGDQLMEWGSLPSFVDDISTYHLEECER